MTTQILVVYRHKENNLFYVSQINEDRLEAEGRVERQYSRARSMHQAIIGNRVSERASGFMFALINTGFTGWEVEHTDIIAVDGTEGAKLKSELIKEMLEADPTLKFVGSDRVFAKGVYGAADDSKPHNWSRKFNVASMKKSKIDGYIDFIMKALNEEIPQRIKTATYMAITSPENFGPRSKNYGSYEVDSLANIFLFVRNSLGFDLP